MMAYRPVKRTLDVMVAVATAPIWLAVAAVVALAVRLSSGAPVLFRQRRTGLGGRIFTIFKFRTMRSGDAPDEERITQLGRFLRKTGLDELPQMVNVLKGDMSMIGPRPLLPEYLPLYSAEQARRHEVRPGISGWAQVRGRNALGWEEKFALDVFYVDHMSLILDAKIVAMTLCSLAAAPFRRKDAASEAIAPPFGG